MGLDDSASEEAITEIIGNKTRLLYQCIEGVTDINIRKTQNYISKQHWSPVRTDLKIAILQDLYQWKRETLR